MEIKPTTGAMELKNRAQLAMDDVGIQGATILYCGPSGSTLHGTYTGFFPPIIF